MAASERERHFRPYYMVDGRVVPPYQLVRTATGWAEPTPARCCNGHPLTGDWTPRDMEDWHICVGWVPCPADAQEGPNGRVQRNGHRTHRCGCGMTVYTPPLEDPICACERPPNRNPYSNTKSG